MFFFFKAKGGMRVLTVTGVQTCALPISLAFVANALFADMPYSLLHRRYEGSLRLGKVDTHFKDYRPIAWMAEAQFSLGKNNIEVSSLKATSGRSRLTGSGRVQNFRELKIEAAYDAALDLAETAAIMRRPEARRGVLHATGQGRSEEHTSELQSQSNLVCRLLLEKKNNN